MTNLFSVKRVLLALGFGVWVMGNAALAADLDISKAEALMKQGKAAEAYALLEPFEFQQAGNVKFDYLLGVAALDSGKADKATIAFERVLAVDPNFAGARVDMGRAYYQLGDFTRARVEFETVLTQNPPPSAKKLIDNYLALISKQEEAKKTVSTAYVEGTVGHDSNINFATSNSSIAVPALGNLVFVLDRTGVKTSDSYMGVNMGSEISHQANPGLGFFAGVELRNRVNNAHDRFDAVSVDARAGVAMGGAANSLRLGMLAGTYDLDGRNNRNTSGLNAEWRYLINPANQVSAFGQHTRYRFEQSINVNDFDQSLYGANWLRVFNDGKGVIFASLFAGHERAPLRADGGKDFNGLRLGGQVQLNAKTELFAGIGTQASKYDLANAAFSTATESRIRDDKQFDASIGINWHYDKAWTVRPQVSYMRNNSNIPLYEFDRTDVSVSIRRDFK